MRTGIQRFAPHLFEVLVALHDTPELAVMLHQVDVVVFAIYADDLGLVVPDGMLAIEYRHIPDAGDVRRLIPPLLEEDSREKLEVRKMS